MALRSNSSATTCRICGTALRLGAPAPPAAPWHKDVCDLRACRARAQRDMMALLQEARRQARTAQLRTAHQVVFVPVNRRRTVRTSAERKAVFRAHLAAMFDAEASRDAAANAAAKTATGISAAAAVPARQPTALPLPLPKAAVQAVAAACGTCRGFCCTTGEKHSWITADTMQRVLHHYPALDRSALTARYVEQLPARSYERSCVYHTARGCALEPSLRSHTCHEYLCSGVAELVQLVRSNHSAPLCIAAAEDSVVVRQRLL